jgi:DNA-binding CsgD family transcriptional regulator
MDIMIVSSDPFIGRGIESVTKSIIERISRSRVPKQKTLRDYTEHNFKYIHQKSVAIPDSWVDKDGSLLLLVYALQLCGPESSFFVHNVGNISQKVPTIVYSPNTLDRKYIKYFYRKGVKGVITPQLRYEESKKIMDKIMSFTINRHIDYLSQGKSPRDLKAKDVPQISFLSDINSEKELSQHATVSNTESDIQSAKWATVRTTDNDKKVTIDITPEMSHAEPLRFFSSDNPVEAPRTLPHKPGIAITYTNNATVDPTVTAAFYKKLEEISKERDEDERWKEQLDFQITDEQLDRLHLSRKKKPIIEGVVLGLTNKDIALRSSLTTGTVRNYICQLFGMFGVKNRTELALTLRNLLKTDLVQD